MPVAIANLQSVLRVPEARVRRLVGRVLRGERRGRERISLAVVDDRRMRALNRKFLRHDYATDVLAFRLDDAYFGEVVVSATTARREAKARGIRAEEELLRYVAHGVLHLLGYKDKTSAARRAMWKKQEVYLKGTA